MERTFELKTDAGQVITWTGTDGEDAARRAADCTGETIVAWREPRVLVTSVHHSQIIG